MIRSALPRAGVLLAALALVALVAAPAASAEFSITGFTATAGSSVAGAHPDLTTDLTFPTLSPEPPAVFPDGNVRDLSVDLPAGLVGDPTAVPRCAQNAFAQFSCPPAAQIGIARIKLLTAGFSFEPTVPLLNMQPHNSDEAGEIAFSFGIVTIHLPITVRTDGDYGLTPKATGVSRIFGIQHIALEIWGVPGDPSHDPLRTDMHLNPVGPSQLGRAPFLTNPSRCDAPLAFRAEADSYQSPGVFSEATAALPQLTGCEVQPFNPDFSLRPQSSRAGEPTGFEATLTVPQNHNPDGQASADLRDASVTLPTGVVLSASAASGLGACDDADLHLGSTAAAACPPSSRIGDMELDVPLLPDPIHGGVYLRRPQPGDLTRIAFVADDFGVHLKIPGDVQRDPQSGQLTASFADAPQVPFEKLVLDFNGGARAPLLTPSRCGTYTTRALLTPWSSGVAEERLSSFTIDQNCDATSRFSPSLQAGTLDPTAGSHSPFVLRVEGEDGQQNVSRIEARLPEGLLAKLKGVGVCGDGAATGDCPASSQVGTATVGAGAGSLPLYVPEPGKAPTAVYLGGPYKGGPYSLVVKVPAQAGPFDLGNVVVRSALFVDPATTQVTAKSDPLPQILQGIPIAYRDVRVEVDRPDFILNPTNCAPRKIESTIVSAGGQAAHPSAPFQIAGCGELGFKPSLKLSLRGTTRRSGNPAVTAVLKAPKGEANIARTAVILPKSEFIDNAHISNPCTRVQFNEGACPKSSILGRATAYTPLLDRPLEGPVYFRSNGGDRELPDLVADLNGQIHVTLVGFIDSVPVKGTESSRVRTRFQNVPDAPVSKFILKLKGGDRGLLANSRNLCSFTPRAKVQMTGQNGKRHDFAAKIGTSCGKVRR